VIVRPTGKTIKLEDMRLFAHVAAAESFTMAARLLGVPKQTLSRRVGELESALGVQLLQRTTRRMRLTEVGAAYAAQCNEVIRLADDANRSVTDARRDPKGVLRITADPLFGDAFLGSIVLEYARLWPDVEIEVLLTRRRVDLVEEGFDAAFRIGLVDDKRLSTTRLLPARVRYCASPKYVRERGAPRTAAELRGHECLVVQGDGEPSRWPVPGKKGLTLVPVRGRLRFNSFAMTYSAALAGLGIGLFPDFACSADLRRKNLVTVLEPSGIDVGAVWLAYPAQRYLASRVREFVDLTVDRLGRKPSWAKDPTHRETREPPED
jgi:DNA-binding transcriptional LysR family regulator